jgi:hypothetical protein
MRNIKNLIEQLLPEPEYAPLKKAILHSNSKSVTDINETAQALKIVPSAILGFLIKKLKPMEIGETKEFKLDVDKGSLMNATKIDKDVYSGDITKNGKRIHGFELVSIPQLGAHLISVFELYDEVKLGKSEQDATSGKIHTIIMEIAERLAKADVKGVHKPASTASSDKGRSEAGVLGNWGKKFDAPILTEGAIEKHRKILEQVRKMPKPNLGKADIESPKLPNDKMPVQEITQTCHDPMENKAVPKDHVKDQYKDLKDGKKFEGGNGKNKDLEKAGYDNAIKGQQGVHKPAFMHNYESGTSDVGARMYGKPSPELKGYATEQHKKILSQLKEMPKPNLGKARVDEGKPTNVKQAMRWDRSSGRSGPNEGVHVAPFKSAPGMSNAGYGLEIGDKGLATENHKHVFNRLKGMKAPSLGKAIGTTTSASSMKPPIPKAMAPSAPMAKPVTAPKTAVAKSETKRVNLGKTETSVACQDCGKGVKHCDCFAVLSAPKLKKTESGNVIARFEGDWDKAQIHAFRQNIKRSIKG